MSRKPKFANDEGTPCLACGQTFLHMVGSPSCLGALARLGSSVADDLVNLRDALALADALAEAAESLAIESEGREFPFDLHPYVRGVVEAAKRYRESRR